MTKEMWSSCLPKQSCIPLDVGPALVQKSISIVVVNTVDEHVAIDATVVEHVG